MQSIDKDSLLNGENTYSADISVEQPREEIEKLDEFHTLDSVVGGIKCENISVPAEQLTVKIEKGDQLNGLDQIIHNSLDQSCIKTEKIEEFFCVNSSNSCDFEHRFDNIDAKTELLSEEYEIPFKEEVFEDISNSKCHDQQITQHVIVQETTKRKRNYPILNQKMLFATSKHAQGISRFKKVCNQCFLCGRVILSPPDYFLFHLLSHHFSLKMLKRNLFNGRFSFIKPTTKSKITDRFKWKLYKNKCKRKLCLRAEVKHNRDKQIKQLSEKSNLTALTLPQTVDKPFKCEVCSEQFHQKDHLKLHSRFHPDKNENFKCEICLRQFKKEIYLKSHMPTHTLKRNCNVTDLTFYQNTNKFKCEVCLKQFIRKSSLTSHMLCHTGEKPFKCEVCLKEFVSKHQLIPHMRSHTGEKPFKCEICLKQFGWKSQLKSHMTSHTGEKPFKCEVCLKQFVRKSTLISHMLCHTDEKPFKCEMCSKQFVHKSRLIVHVQSHITI